MKQKNTELVEKFRTRHPQLNDAVDQLLEAADMLVDTYKKGGKVLVCGNGGSASDAEHIVGELMKGFCLKRELPEKIRGRIKAQNPDEAQFLCDNLQQALPAISLVSHSALITAFMNDVEPSMVFAQQVLGYGKPEDTLIGLSTSGNSENVINAIRVANSIGLHTVGLTGACASKMSELCDVTIQAPQKETYLIQEEHIKLYHLLCLIIENEFFG